jgi:hypothetical protein
MTIQDRRYVQVYRSKSQNKRPRRDAWASEVLALSFSVFAGVCWRFGQALGLFGL